MSDKSEPAGRPHSSSDQHNRNNTEDEFIRENYALSGDFRGATINIKSTIISHAEVKDLENLPPEPGETPYQGMQFFDEKDANRFFGREALVAKIARRLASTPFLTIIGASGSGKSSLVRAGVIPALRRGERLIDGSMPPYQSSQWEIRVLTPSAHPLDMLAASLALEPNSPEVVAKLRAEIALNSQLLSQASQRLLTHSSQPHLLWVIDQFEEVFTQCRQDEEREAFIENLIHAASTRSQTVSVLLILRADFYAQLAHQEHLREIISQNQEFIRAMSRDELMRAILQPAELGNWKVQEGLVDVMLDDLDKEPGALPLLSHTLLETWKKRRGRVLTLAGYVATGGVRGAIAQTAETVFRQKLTPTQQPIARMIFVKLVEMGEHALDTRRRATFSELITRSVDPMTIDMVLHILSDARLVTIGTVEPGETRVIEVAHEALIREWSTLRDWLNENREGLTLHRQLTEDTNDWLKLRRDTGALYRGVRLQQVLNWAKNNSDLISVSEQEFLDASQQINLEETTQARQLRRARWIQIGLGNTAVGLVFVIFIVILAANGYFAPRKMTGVYNIAVGEFGKMVSEGHIQPIKNGEQISGWVVNYLSGQVAGDPNILIWPNQGNLFNRTRVPITQKETAEAIMNEIGADILLYGYVDVQKSPPELILEFRVAPQVNYGMEDITEGVFSVGEPIRVADPDDLGFTVQSELKRQASAYAWVSLGLAHEQLGQAEAALEAFQQAVGFAPESEAIWFFLGREYLFLSERKFERREENWQAAEAAFQEAVRLNATYARAYVGLGSLYFKRATDLLDVVADSSNYEQAEQWGMQAMQAYQTVLELKPSTTDYGNPVQDVAQIALGNVYRLHAIIEIKRGNQTLALEYLHQSIQILEMMRPIFVQHTQKIEAHRRYLAQIDEHLGEAYQWQGYIFEMTFDYAQALDSYSKAVSYFNACMEHGEAEATLDLILLNDIIEKFCKPYHATTLESLATVEAILNKGQ